MKIALIFPNYSRFHRKFEEDIDIVGREFGLLPPLGLAYAASIMEEAGHEVIIIDSNALFLSKEETVLRLKSFRPDLLAFMLTVWTFPLTLDWIRHIKSAMKLPVLVGNIQMELYPEETFTHQEIDYGIIGSAQKALPGFLSALNDGKDFSGIKGLVYRKERSVVINRPDTFREDFATLPFPSRHLLPNSRYREVMSKRKNLTIMITSKGCPSKCSFCHIKETPYSSRNPQSVAEEVEQCYKQFSIREIDIFDPSFTIDKKRVIDICREIRKKNVDIHFSCRARVDQIDEELLDEMSATGFKRIQYGLESGDQSILDRVNKGINLKQIKKVVAWTKQRGISALGFFLIGAPGDNYCTVRKTIQFAKDLDLDYAQFHKVMAKPRTELYEQIKRLSGRDYWRDFVLGNATEERLPSPWTGLSQKEIEDFTIRAYQDFYFRPSYIWKTFVGIRSLDEFKRYARSALGLLNVKSDIT